MLKVTIEPGAFSQLRNALSGYGKQRVLRAVGYKLRDIARSNFGESGPDRPEAWPPYASGAKKGQPATLIDTGALRENISVTTDANSVTVSADTDYASYHHDGTRKMPRRRFFPVQDGQLTPAAQAELQRVAEEEILAMLR